jgi:hypothetical protein
MSHASRRAASAGGAAIKVLRDGGGAPDRYYNQPVMGNKNNDILLTGGLGFTFGARTSKTFETGRTR